MGFVLWLDGEMAWAQGTHEYRPMGTAVIAARGQFRARDFAPARHAPARDDQRLMRLFASLGELNAYLRTRRSPKFRRNLRRAPFSLPACL